MLSFACGQPGYALAKQFCRSRFEESQNDIPQKKGWPRLYHKLCRPLHNNNCTLCYKGLEAQLAAAATCSSASGSTISQRSGSKEGAQSINYTLALTSCLAAFGPSAFVC